MGHFPDPTDKNTWVVCVVEPALAGALGWSFCGSGTTADLPVTRGRIDCRAATKFPRLCHPASHSPPGPEVSNLRTEERDQYPEREIELHSRALGPRRPGYEGTWRRTSLRRIPVMAVSQ
jgi:hypothetical protein